MKKKLRKQLNKYLSVKGLKLKPDPHVNFCKQMDGRYRLHFNVEKKKKKAPNVRG